MDLVAGGSTCLQANLLRGTRQRPLWAAPQPHISLQCQPRTHWRRRMSNAGRPPSSLALGGSQQGGDAAAGLHSTLESAAASVGDGFEQATEQARATLNGNSAEPREEAPGKQQRRRRQKVADPKPSAGSEAGAISFEQAAQSVAKGIQHISTRSQAAMDRLRDGDSSEEEEEEAVPSLLFWHRSNDSSSSSGNGSRAAAAARESLGEADGLIARARQNANKGSSVLSASASDSASSFMHTLGGGLSTLGQHMQDVTQNSLGSGGDSSAPGRGAGAGGSSGEEQQNEGASGGVAVARGTLDRVERHRLPAALLAALLAGCLRPQWGAAVPGGGAHLQAALLAAVFFLYGLNFGRTALFAGGALYAWGGLALQQVDIWRHRYVWPRTELGAAAKELKLQSKSSVLVLQGVETRRGEAAKALLSWQAAVWGAFSSLLLTPLSALTGPALPLWQAPGLALGLAAWYCVPTTLSRSISLTERAGGNTAFALLTAVATNILALITLPVIVGPLLSRLMPGDVSMPAPFVVCCALFRLCVLPLAAGVVARRCFKVVARAVDSHSRLLSYVGAAALAATAWLAISRGLAAPGVPAVTPGQLAVVAAAATAAHAAFLGVNTFVVHHLQLGGNDAPESYLYEGSAFDEEAHKAQALAVELAAVVVASQKTLPVTLALLGLLATSGGGGAGGMALWLATGGGSAGGGAALCGTATAAAVTAHLAQTLVDAAAGWAWLRYDPWAKKTAKRTRQAAQKMGYDQDDSGLTTA